MTDHYLVDTSVWARYRKEPVKQRLDQLLTAGRVATCAISQLEALREAFNRAEVDTVLGAQAGLYWLSTPDEVWDRVLEVQSELSATGHRTSVKIPDLILAAVAERHRTTLLHYDHDFDAIAKITEQPVEWVVPAGTAN